MKKIQILFLLLILAGQLLAQESKEYKKLKKKYNYWEAYIIKRDSSKVEGLVKDYITYINKIHSSVNFINKDGTKTSYQPYQIRGFKYAEETYVSDTNYFYELMVEGEKTSLYRIITLESKMEYVTGIGSTNSAYFKENFYVKGPHERYFKLLDEDNFQSEAIDYFKDCAFVADEIKNGKYSYDDIEAIVAKYNDCE